MAPRISVLMSIFAVIGLLCAFGDGQARARRQRPVHPRGRRSPAGSARALVALGNVGRRRRSTTIDPGLGLAVRLLPCVLLVATPRIQELQMRADPDAVGRRVPRPYSLLAYATVAGSQILLVWRCWTRTDPDAVHRGAWSSARC